MTEPDAFRIRQDGLDKASKEILWHVEQVCGQLNRVYCEVEGDDDYSILRHNVALILRAERDKERDAITAWIRSGSCPYVEGYAEECAGLIAANQHRSAEHG